MWHTCSPSYSQTIMLYCIRLATTLKGLMNTNIGRLVTIQCSAEKSSSPGIYLDAA